MPFDGCNSAGAQRPLRVALFSGNYNYTLDGANKSLNRLVDHLQRVEGFRVRVYSPTTDHPAFEPKGELVSVPSTPIPLRSDYRLALGLPPPIRRDVEAFSPDIVHLSAPDLLGLGALRLARRLGVPAVASVHTLFEAYLEYYALGWLRPTVERRLQAFYAAADKVLVPSQALLERFCAIGLPSDRLAVWGRGVDPRTFAPQWRDEDWRQAQGIARDEVVVVFFGRLVMEKGLAVFADAIDGLRARRRGVQVLVVGDGPARGWLQARLPDALYLGFQTGDALSRAVASGDLLLNPSNTETFGNVSLEAMASGLPVVGADAPYHRCLVREGETGLLVPPFDAGAYADALEQLVDDPARRRAMGAAARASALDFRWERILSKVAEVYRAALACSPSTAAAA